MGNLHPNSNGAESSSLVEAGTGLSETELNKFITDAKIDVSKYGTGHAKTLKEFSDELLVGDATLSVQPDGTLSRVVDVVVLLLTRGIDGETLVETQEILPDGSTVNLGRLPAIKRRPDENQFVAAQKLLKKKLRMDSIHVKLDSEDVKIIEERKESPSYPGISTLYRKRIISGSVELEKSRKSKGGFECFVCTVRQ